MSGAVGERVPDLGASSTQPRPLFAVEAERGEIGPGVDPVPGAAAETWAEQRTDRIGAVRDHWNIASLVLFHLIEYLDVPYEVDVAEINRRWGKTESVDEWSQLVIKETRKDVELLTAAPKTGIYALDENGQAAFKRWGNDWHSLHDESEAFYLRVLGTGDYRYPGADLGLLVARSRMQTDDNQLTERARQWIEAIREQFAGTPADATEKESHPHDALAFKTA